MPLSSGSDVESFRIASNIDITLRWMLMKQTKDDGNLYGWLIALHVLHDAAEKPLYGRWMIAELRRHGYQIGPWTMYRLLHRLAGEGYLLRKQQRSDSRYRKVYQITPSAACAEFSKTSCEGVVRRDIL
jgi:hypothetical protein